ncbi:MAG: hypothetical protein KTV16_14100 [Acidimicrobiia bacterium]|nr:hypothetical protein [Acidimicrobiia bacterium]MCY4457948.1 hypothetical protein [Acidimicrobiaceae bacterium]
MTHRDLPGLQRFARRRQLCQPSGGLDIVAMPGGHEALFSNPELLATKIIEAGRN